MRVESERLIFWKITGTVLRHVRIGLVAAQFLTFLSVAAWNGSSLAQQETVTPGTELVTVNQSAENGALRVAVSSYQLVAQKLTETAPQGFLFLVLEGALINKSATKPLALTAVEQSFFLHSASEEHLAPHELSRDTAAPFWGDLSLAPGEEYPIQLVFAVPARTLHAVSLNYDGPSGGIAVHVSLDANAAVDASPNTNGCGRGAIPLDTAAENTTLRLILEAYCQTAQIGGQTAPENGRFFVVKGRFISRSADTLSIPPVSQLLRLQLAAGVTLDAAALTDTALSPSFAATPLQPGDARSFEIAFAVPQEALSQATIIHPAAAGVLIIPVIAPEMTDGVPLAKTKTDQLIVNALRIDRLSLLNGIPPTPGHAFVTVSLKLEAATEQAAVIALEGSRCWSKKAVMFIRPSSATIRDR